MDWQKLFFFKQKLEKQKINNCTNSLEISYFKEWTDLIFCESTYLKILEIKKIEIYLHKIKSYFLIYPVVKKMLRQEWSLFKRENDVMLKKYVVANP